jgi:hypothetical protein
MGNRRLYKIECLHMLGTRESDRLKVTALNLFYPTASPPFQKVSSFEPPPMETKGCYYDTTQPLREDWLTIR